jgi:hypothetical protein
MKNLTNHLRLITWLLMLLIIMAACRPNASGSDNSPEAPQTTTEQEATPIAAAPTAVPTLEPTTTAAPADTAVPTAPPPTETPPPTATALPTSTPSPTPLPTQTETPPPTDTPLPTLTPTIEPPPLPEWLVFLNRFREMANLPPVLDWEPYNLGSAHHSRYMVVNDQAIAHKEDPDNYLYDPAGDQAAKNGNLFATSQTDANYVWSINFWASAPFHLVGMLDPNLKKVGYGDFVEAGGDVAMAGVLDIGSDPGGNDPTQYPVLFPGPNSATWIVRHSLYEWPDPLASCPNLSRPTGAPIVVFLGDGSLTPRVENKRLAMGDTPLDVCIFDETTYSNPDPYAQKKGREILSHQNAVVIIPNHPLAAEETYTVQLTANGETYTWQFDTIKRPD